MIPLKQVLAYHAEVVRQTGGADGLRDVGILESALQRPFQTFGGQELYPTPFEKAAAIMESVIVNHPFVDGNKRTGYIFGRMILLEYGYDLAIAEDIRYDTVIAIASGNMRYEEILAWLKDNTQKI